MPCETSRRHICDSLKVLWLGVTNQAGWQCLYNHLPDLLLDGTLSVGQKHCKRHGVLSSGRLLCVRYNGKGPLFQQACCCSVRFETASINHQPGCKAILFHKFGKDFVEVPQPTPSDKAIIVWPIFRRGIFPLEAVLNDINNAADNTSVINSWDSMGTQTIKTDGFQRVPGTHG